MKVVEKSTGITFEAIYATTKSGNKRMNVNGKFYSDEQFDRLFEKVTEDVQLEWTVHTDGLTKEILNNQGCQILTQPLNIFRSLLVQVGERAAQLNDPVLNALMCRLVIYSIADPYSKDYNPALVEQIKANPEYKAFAETRS